MMTEYTTLGIDVSKSKFDVALFRNNKLKNKKFSNNLKGFESLLDWLEKLNAVPVHVCMEATGVYGEALSEYLYDTGFTVSVVNPARIKGFAQSELLRTKTDKADAGLIARFCYAMKPKAWSPQPKEIRQLRDLVRRLDALNAMHQQELNRLEAVSDIIEDQLLRQIDYLDSGLFEKYVHD